MRARCICTRMSMCRAVPVSARASVLFVMSHVVCLVMCFASFVCARVCWSQLMRVADARGAGERPACCEGESPTVVHRSRMMPCESRGCIHIVGKHRFRAPCRPSLGLGLDRWTLFSGPRGHMCLEFAGLPGLRRAGVQILPGPEPKYLGTTLVTAQEDG